MKFLKQLKQRRREYKITQEKMAFILGITRGQYTRLENGNSKITLEQYEKAMNYINKKEADYETKSN